MANSSAVALVDFHVRVDDRTEIRPFHLMDAEELQALVVKNHAHLYPWMTWLSAQPQSLQATREFLNASVKAAREQTQFNAAIVRDGKIIGTTGFPIIDWQNRLAHIGYWLDCDHTGQGIMTAAVRALVGYAFDALELNRIEIRCADRNLKSAAVPERLGFKLEGVLRQVTLEREAFRDDRVYGMLRDEWEAGP